MKRLFILLLFSPALASALMGCARNTPREIEREPKPSLKLAEVRSGPVPIGARVRWGGVIANIENKKDETWLEIVERDLDRRGRPRGNDRSTGRFLARVPGFLEPTSYAQGRLVTVSGALEPNQTRRIGEHDYTFAVVAVHEHYLWPKQQPRRYADPGPPPLWYYDPWYPLGWGWGPHYPHHHHHFFH